MSVSPGKRDEQTDALQLRDGGRNVTRAHADDLLAVTTVKEAHAAWRRSREEQVSG